METVFSKNFPKLALRLISPKLMLTLGSATLSWSFEMWCRVCPKMGRWNSWWRMKAWVSMRTSGTNLKKDMPIIQYFHALLKNGDDAYPCFCTQMKAHPKKNVDWWSYRCNQWSVMVQVTGVNIWTFLATAWSPDFFTAQSWRSTTENHMETDFASSYPCFRVTWRSFSKALAMFLDFVIVRFVSLQFALENQIAGEKKQSRCSCNEFWEFYPSKQSSTFTPNIDPQRFALAISLWACSSVALGWRVTGQPW